MWVRIGFDTVRFGLECPEGASIWPSSCWDMQVGGLLLWAYAPRGHPSCQGRKGGGTVEKGRQLFRGRALMVWGCNPKTSK
eukprot:scaffold48516_cov39-Attheya_sp.AAC.1